MSLFVRGGSSAESAYQEAAREIRALDLQASGLSAQTCHQPTDLDRHLNQYQDGLSGMALLAPGWPKVVAEVKDSSDPRRVEEILLSYGFTRFG